jgi:hypothetical protein
VRAGGKAVVAVAVPGVGRAGGAADQNGRFVGVASTAAERAKYNFLKVTQTFHIKFS